MTSWLGKSDTYNRTLKSELTLNGVAVLFGFKRFAHDITESLGGVDPKMAKLSRYVFKVSFPLVSSESCFAFNVAGAHNCVSEKGGAVFSLVFRAFHCCCEAAFLCQSCPSFDVRCLVLVDGLGWCFLVVRVIVMAGVVSMSWSEPRSP